jgi:hypothetical protein
MALVVFDTAAQDGGFLKCMSLSKVADPIVKFMVEQGVEHLNDFIHSCSASDYKERLPELWLKKAKDESGTVGAYYENPIQLARIRLAWMSAQKAQDKVEAANPPGGEHEGDIEDPLELGAVEELKTHWKNTYPHIAFDEFSGPADAVMARQFREFRRKTHTLLPLSKVKAMAWDRVPKDTKREHLGAGLVLESNAVDLHTSLHNAYQYYWALRILCHTWAYVGNYKVKSWNDPSKEVMYFSLGQGLHYADTAYRRAMENARGEGQLHWLRERDELTRGKALLLAREGWPFGEALEAAVADKKLEWTLSQKGPIGGSGGGGGNGDRDRDRDRDRRRSRSPKGKGTRKEKKALNKEKDGRVGSTLPGGAQICRSFNQGRCQKKEKDCPGGRKHVCDRMLSSTGKVCGQPPARTNCTRQ